jgi:ribosomal protein L28
MAVARRAPYLTHTCLCRTVSERRGAPGSPSPRSQRQSPSRGCGITTPEYTIAASLLWLKKLCTGRVATPYNAPCEPPSPRAAPARLAWTLPRQGHHARYPHVLLQQEVRRRARAWRAHCADHRGLRRHTVPLRPNVHKASLFSESLDRSIQTRVTTATLRAVDYWVPPARCRRRRSRRRRRGRPSPGRLRVGRHGLSPSITQRTSHRGAARRAGSTITW